MSTQLIKVFSLLSVFWVTSLHALIPDLGHMARHQPLMLKNNSQPFAVNGSIEIGAHSIINSHVENVNGSIKLLAVKVLGNVETVNGSITLGENTIISGHLKVAKPSGWGINWGKPKVPRIIIGPNAQVVGNLIFEREVELYVHSTAKYGKIMYLEAEADKASSLKPIVFTGKEPTF